MKTAYITPALRTVALTESDALLLTASGDNGNILESGVRTSEGGIIEGDVKHRSTTVDWDNWE